MPVNPTPGSQLAALNQQALGLMDQKLTLINELNTAQIEFVDVMSLMRHYEGRAGMSKDFALTQLRTKEASKNPLHLGTRIQRSLVDDLDQGESLHQEDIDLQAHAKKIVSSIDEKTSALAQLQQQLDAVKAEIAKLNAPQPVDKHVDPFSND